MPPLSVEDLPPKKDVKGGSPKSPSRGIRVSEYQDQTNGGKTFSWLFWHGFNIGHVLIILGMVCTAFWWFITYDRDFTIAKMTVSQQAELLKKLSDRVDGIDEHGTHFSQSGLRDELGLMADNSKRVTKLEEINVALLPRIERMDINLQQCADWVKEQRQNKR